MRGVVVLSADRLAGVTAVSSTASTMTTFTSTGSSSGNGATLKEDVEESSTSVNLLWNGGASNIFAIPRLAIDGFVAPQVTLGGSAGFLSRSGSTKNTSVARLSGSSTSVSKTSENDLPDVSAFVISPRLGVVVTLGPNVALWLRGGVTYYQTSLESKSIDRPVSSGDPTVTTNVKSETSGTAATLDAQLVFVPVEHVGITIGPVFDFGLGGSTKTTTSTTASTGSVTSTVTDTATREGDITQSNYGVAAGIAAFF